MKHKTLIQIEYYRHSYEGLERYATDYTLTTSENLKRACNDHFKKNGAPKFTRIIIYYNLEKIIKVRYQNNHLPIYNNQV